MLPWFTIAKYAAPVVIAAVVWFHGYSTGKQSVYDKLADDRITILKDGKEIDKDVEGLDDDALCGVLGGC